MKECECHEAHTVAKLGHARGCPYHRPGQPTMIDASLAVCSLQNNHSAGTPHDFEWATLHDETIGTGVCRCGELQINYDMARLP